MGSSGNPGTGGERRKKEKGWKDEDSAYGPVVNYCVDAVESSSGEPGGQSTEQRLGD